MRSAVTVRSVTFVSALLMSTAFTAPAFADIEIVVVTAEKRLQDVQTVPVAISVFTSEKRDLVGINSIQDMTNFTPGLQYNTSTDRVSLRGVGRQTNVLSADASVANYDDGLYETFAVAAGRSSLDLDRVEVLRGPQGTLYGRNAIGGALNEITRRPTDQFEAEVRATYTNYDHVSLEAAVSGPITDDWGYRVYFNWDKQSQGYAKNIIPGAPQEDGLYNNWYGDAQLQGKFFNGKLDMWTKIQSARWYGGAGNAGSQSSGWNPYDVPTYEYGVAATALNPGYGCTTLPGFAGPTSATSATTPTGVTLAQACRNPEVGDPWKISRPVPYNVKLPDYFSLNTQWTWHANGFDIKYIGGGTFYHYILTGDTSDEGGGSDARSPILSFTVPGGPGTGNAVIYGAEAFNYQERNGFISNEVNFLSTGDGPLQWVAGAYQFQQHYDQPVYTQQPAQVQWGGVTPPFGAPGFFCAQTGGVCAPEVGFRRFDNRPVMHASSYAAFFQLDYKLDETLKLTGGLRYSYDRKNGVENVRLLCFAVPACGATIEAAGSFTPAFDLTQLGNVVDNGLPPYGIPKGVKGITTYSAATGFASRQYDATWGATTGTAGVEWTPDEQTLVYGKYARGYKSGGFNVGIFTVLSYTPWTDSEHVNSFEVGAKHTFGNWLTTNVAVFHYDYKNLQIPLAVVNSAGGLSQSATSFYNVPDAISQGVELETFISPMENMNIIFNYSYLDAHTTKGSAPDPADPNATAAGATPMFTPAQCNANALLLTPTCSPDIYVALPVASGGTNGVPGTANGLNWNIPQNLKGNDLPNAPRNKIAFNISYNFMNVFGDEGTFTPSISYVWRDKQYGTLFTRSYNAAPSWDQVDARVRYMSKDDHWEAILFGKNIFDTIGYDSGASGARLAGTIDRACGGGPGTCNFVQGVNNPVGYGAVRGEDATGHVSTYYVTPPATYGIEVHYKF
ncbi:MAG TPA: TonB-dependent receptor [Rhizomicrobium sp.]